MPRTTTRLRLSDNGSVALTRPRPETGGLAPGRRGRAPARRALAHRATRRRQSRGEAPRRPATAADVRNRAGRPVGRPGSHAERGVEHHQLGAIARTGRGHRLAQVQEAAQVDDGVELAAQVRHAHHPGLGVRHRRHLARGVDLAGLGQGQQQAHLAAFDGKPAGLAGAFARGLEPVGQPQLKFPQGVLAGHRRWVRTAGCRDGAGFNPGPGSWPAGRPGRPA